SGYVLEHQFDLSNQNLAAWIKDFIKKTVLSFIFSLALIEVLFFLIWNFTGHWWVFAWAGFALVSYGVGKIFPVWIIPLFYKYGKVESESLTKRIIDLAARYGLPVENVYTLNLSKTTKKANAAFMGIGRTKRVVLSDTLIQNFSENEIETVVAHELGHFKHRDIWRQLALGLVTSLFAFWLAFRVMDPLSGQFGLQGAGDIASLPLLFLIFYAVSLILMPLQNGFSRWLERGADRFALQACPERDIFISCMEKLGQVNLANPNPHPVYEWFFYDHPSIHKRIQMAKNRKD
ncbi:MAG TPA: M48 family metallopeptidase, partial [bacterium]|nr:M48 family metallopeptidase [bacterium]